MRVLVIKPFNLSNRHDIPICLKEIDGSDTAASINKEVGGWIELVNLGQGVLGWVNEDGVQLGLDRNSLATGICVGAGKFPPTHNILGNMVFTGENGDECTDVPESFVKHVRSFFPEYFQ